MSDDDQSAELSHNLATLQAEILSRSIAKTWDEAIIEWELAHIEHLPSGTPPGTCLCSHHPIRELCHLAHTTTGATTIVGNVCVEHFMGIEVGKLFTSLRRIRKNLDAGVSKELADFLYASRVIDAYERDFCRRTHGKARLTERQHDFRHRLNERIISRTTACSLSSYPPSKMPTPNSPA